MRQNIRIYFLFQIETNVDKNFFQPTPTSRFIIGYIGAVTSAVGIAVCIRSVLFLMNSKKNYHNLVR